MFTVKKVALAVAACSVMALSASSMANTLVFTGAVTSSTCDVQAVSSSGVVTPEIQLGSIEPGATASASAVNFKLAPVNSASCNETKADMTWTSENLILTGLKNTGSAGGVHIELRPVNADDANPIDGNSPVTNGALIKGGSNLVKYIAAAETKLNKSFNYTAQLAVDSPNSPTVGSVATSATYTVAYY